MDFLNLQLEGQMSLNFNSVENLPGFEARVALTLNSAIVFTPVGRGYSAVKEDVNNQRPFNIIDLIERDGTGKFYTQFLSHLIYIMFFMMFKGFFVILHGRKQHFTKS